MKKVLIIIPVALVFGFVMNFEGTSFDNYSVSISTPSAQATKIRTRGKCSSAKKQYKSYNRALRRQIKDLKKAHKRIFKVSPNRIVGYTQEVLNKTNGVTQAARNLKRQATIIQRECVRNKQMNEPLI